MATVSFAIGDFLVEWNNIKQYVMIVTTTAEIKKIQEEINRHKYIMSVQPPKDKFIKVGGVQIF